MSRGGIINLFCAFYGLYEVRIKAPLLIEGALGEFGLFGRVVPDYPARSTFFGVSL
jgi:hypothetical protein